MIKKCYFLLRTVCIWLIVTVFSINLSFANLDDNEKIDINEIKNEVVSTSNNIENEPKLNSRVAAIYDRLSGKLLYGKNEDKQTPMASTTKIMSAVVTVENSKLTDVVKINAKAAGTGGSRLGLKKNDKITVNDLLYGLMLRSGNDAAIALAIHVGGSVEGFAELMNKKAKELKLVNTHFVVPHGLDMEGHYTTAYELAKITDYALKNKKIREVVSTKTTTVSINGRPKTISNTNELLGSLNGVYGVKTGFTNGAGRCLVTACKRGELDVITVVIGADTKKYRTLDSIKLIQYAFKNYKVIDIESKILEKFEQWKKINQSRIVVNKGIQTNVDLKLEELPYKKIAIQNTKEDDIDVKINSLYYFEAPVKENEIIGNVKIAMDNDILDILQIYNKTEINKKGIKDYMVEFLKVF